MLVLTIIALSLLAGVNYVISGRSLFYPPAVFSATWAGGLLVILLAGKFFFQLLPQTLLIFLCGAIAFSLGGFLARPVKGPVKEESLEKAPDRILGLLVWILVLGTPVAIYWVMKMVAESKANNFLSAVSFLMTDEDIQGSPGLWAFGTFVTLGMFVALLTFQEKKQKKARAAVAIVFAFGLCVLTAGRSGIVSLLFGFICLDWIEKRRVRWKFLAVIATVFLVLCIVIAVALGKAGASSNQSLADNAVPVVHGLVLYASGSLVTFDRVIREPTLIPHGLQLSEFFIRILDKLGANLPVPSGNAGYLDIGQGRDPVLNTYSIYFCYIDLGYVGMMGVVLFVGMVVTATYHRAVAGNKIAAILYSMFFAGMILSLFAEGFFHNLDYLIKLYAVCWLFYRFPAAWRRFNRFVNRAVSAGLAKRQGV